MVASDVAVAINMADSGETPKPLNKKNNTGTMTMPPPTPNNPAKIPAKMPVAAKAKKVVALVVKNSMMFMVLNFIYFY